MADDRLPPISIPESTAQFRILGVINELHRRFKGLSDGRVADYIPELAKANADWFGIVVVTTDGQIYEVGDCSQLFTIQSISKPFVYGQALDDYGRDFVAKKVGVEPTGDAFNSIELDQRSNRPHNPMVNAGAIAMSSIVKGTDPTNRLNHLLDTFRRYVGHDMFVDMAVYMSERTSGHRNRAIAHLMLNFGMIDADVNAALDLYFQQCSLMVTCRDLAVMAATLANKGVNPITRQRAIQSQHVKDVLSVMLTCGMYDYSGEWTYSVGLPAKSGVGGGIISVVPRQAGIAIFSPPLDERGNSTRGVRVCEELSKLFRLHMFDVLMGESEFENIVTDTATQETPSGNGTSAVFARN